MSEVNGWDSHVEHFIPRNISNVDQHSIRAADVELSYENLLISCNGEHGDKEHCGRFKGREDSSMLLSPLMEDIEECFTYKLTGEMDGVGAEAMTTIRILNLNSYALTRHRKTAIYTSGFLMIIF